MKCQSLQVRLSSINSRERLSSLLLLLIRNTYPTSSSLFRPRIPFLTVVISSSLIPLGRFRSKTPPESCHAPEGCTTNDRGTPTFSSHFSHGLPLPGASPQDPVERLSDSVTVMLLLSPRIIMVGIASTKSDRTARSSKQQKESEGTFSMKALRNSLGDFRSGKRFSERRHTYTKKWNGKKKS